jgi:uncharacterized membrane protein
MTFFIWGMIGLTVEIVFTAIKRVIINRKIDLMGHASLWMFPIYGFGLTYGIEWLRLLIPTPALRYLAYPFIIWAVEVLVGYPTSKRGVRIWDYNYLPDNFHWRGIISYVHFPLWIGFGILVEILHKYV